MELAGQRKTAAIGGLVKVIGIKAALIIFLVIGLCFFAIPFFSQDESGIVGGDPSEFALQTIPAKFMPIYKAAEKAYGVPWNLLAAHHKIETEFSTNVSASYVGAIGHMQFMDCTFVGWKYPTCSGLGNGGIPKDVLMNPKVIQKYGGYGVDANGDGKADPWNVEDAIFSAANYLAASGAADGDLEKAVYSYNHSQEYVDEVLKYANAFAKMDSGSISVGSNGFAWPVPFTHEITSPFGWRIHPIKHIKKFHDGIDIAAPGIFGQKVVSVAPGRVSFAGYMGGYGNTVVIQHENGIETLYGHLNSITAKSGQNVKPGQKIGAVGSTGLSTGPHLHLRAKKNGNLFDPMTLLK